MKIQLVCLYSEHLTGFTTVKNALEAADRFTLNKEYGAEANKFLAKRLLESEAGYEIVRGHGNSWSIGHKHARLMRPGTNEPSNPAEDSRCYGECKFLQRWVLE